MPAGHPKAAAALEQYGHAARQSEKTLALAPQPTSTEPGTTQVREVSKLEGVDRQGNADDKSVIGKPQLWKISYRDETKETIASEIARRSNEQLMADISASRAAAKTATDDASRKAYTAGAGKLEAEAVKRGLAHPAPAKSALQDRKRADKGKPSAGAASIIASALTRARLMASMAARRRFLT